MSISEFLQIVKPYFGKLLKTWQALTFSKKCALSIAVAALFVCIALCTSCGTTRTTVRTTGKGTTNATISVTTNNPTSVSVETRLDSTKLQINKASK